MISLLSYLHSLKKSYSVISLQKTVILETIKLLQCEGWCNLNVINRYMRGLFVVNPPKPRYTTTWDVSKVLNLLLLWSPLRSLTLKKLTLKLIALLALATAGRTQTLCSFQVDNIKFNDTGVVIFCGDKLKSSKSGVPFVLDLKTFNNEALCPVRTLKFYIQTTRNLRKSKQLFISFVTYKAVSTSTLARWLKTVLCFAGINVEIYKAHSFRGASTSAAFLHGCKMTDILKTADWTSAKNFQKFYLRKLDNDTPGESTFSETVLNSLTS